MIPEIPHLVLALDPISLIGIALAGIAGFGASKAFSGGGGDTPAPTPQAPPAPAASVPPQQQPIGSKATPRGNTPSFLGAAATPPVQSGQKTLLGQ